MLHRCSRKSYFVKRPVASCTQHGNKRTFVINQHFRIPIFPILIIFNNRQIVSSDVRIDTNSRYAAPLSKRTEAKDENDVKDRIPSKLLEKFHSQPRELIEQPVTLS